MKKQAPNNKIEKAELQVLQSHIDGMLQRVRHNSISLRRLQDFELRILNIQSLAEAVYFILTELKIIFELDIVSLCIVNINGNITEILESSDFRVADNNSLILLNEDEALLELLNDKKTIINPKSTNNINLFCDEKPASSIIAPLIKNNNIIGSINLGSHNLNRFNDSMATDFMSHLASVTSICLENILNIEEIKNIYRFEKNAIVRTLDFPEGYEQAGFSVLSYFNRVVQQKYKNIKIKISITQTEHRITMIIVMPDGTEENIEKTLDDYGKVVCGTLDPEIFFDEEDHILQLKNQLNIINLQLQIARTQLEIKVTHFKDEIKFLREIILNFTQRSIPSNLNFNHSVNIDSKIMTSNKKSTEHRNIFTQGGNYIESNEGTYIQGDNIDFKQSLESLESEIQSLIDKFLAKGLPLEVVQENIAKDLATSAQEDNYIKDKLSSWAKNMAISTANDVTKKVVLLALRLAGVPLP